MDLQIDTNIMFPSGLYQVRGSLNVSPHVLNPEDYGTCVEWLKGDDYTAGTWTAALGSDATQAAAGARPTAVSSALNSHKVVRFDGVDDILATGDLNLGTWTIFAVWRASANGLVYEVSPTANSNPGGYLYTNTGASIAARGDAGVSLKDISANWGSDSTWRCTCHVNDGTNAGHGIYLNGVLADLTPAASGDPGTAAFSQPLYIGGRSGAAALLTGDIAEIIVFNGALNTTNRQAVEAYLVSRYGL